MISHELNKLLIVQQTLPVSTKRNVSRSVWRICILILGCKGLLCSRRHNNQKFSITPNTRSISLDNYYRQNHAPQFPPIPCKMNCLFQAYQSRIFKATSYVSKFKQFSGSMKFACQQKLLRFRKKKKIFVRGKGVEMVNQQTGEFVIFDGAT